MGNRRNQINLKLYGILDKIKDAIEELKFDQKLLDSAERCMKLILDKQYEVAVMGWFNRGKSTIINALLEKSILPDEATPTTATINRIKYGPYPGKAVIKFKKGGEKEIPIGELKTYVTKITSENAEQAAKVEEAVVYYPTNFCSDDIDLIDTPGLNESDEMKKITENKLKSVDAVIMPILVNKPLDEKETEFVCKLINTNGVDNIIFVVNFMDLLENDQFEEIKEYVNNRIQTNAIKSKDKLEKDYYVKEYVKDRIQTNVINSLKESNSGEEVIARAHQLLDNINICCISAKLALSEDPQKRKESRFDEFKELLDRLIIQKYMENIQEKTIKNIKRIISEFEAQNKKRLDYFYRKEKKLKSLEPAFLGYADDMKKFLGSVFNESREKIKTVTEEVSQYIRYVNSFFIKELYAVMENTDPCIRAALTKASNDALSLVRGKAPNIRIYGILEETAQRLILFRKEKLDDLFKRFGVPYSDLPIESLTDYAVKVLKNNKKTKFDWIESPIPPATVYLQKSSVNPIEDVTRIVNNSLMFYKRELEEAANAIQENWRKKFNEDADSDLTIIKDLGEQKNNLVQQKSEYEHSYRVKSEKAREFLADCEKIRAESQ